MSMDFKNFNKLLKQALKEIEIQILVEEPTLTPEELKELLVLAKQKLLEESGINPQEFADYEQSLKEIGKAKSAKKKEELNQTLSVLEEKIVSKIPPEKEIPAPQIINKTEIVKEVIKEKPTIIQKTIHTTEIKEKLATEPLNALKDDLNALQSSFLDLYARVDNIRIPEEIDVKLLKKEISEDNANYINGLWGNMPDWRQAIMGLQNRIDGLSSSFLGLTDTPNTYVGAANKSVSVKSDESGLEFTTNISTDEKVKLSASDPTAGYLDAKLVESNTVLLCDQTTPQSTVATFRFKDLAKTAPAALTYNGSGQLTQVAKTGGGTYTFTYNGNGTLNTKSDGVNTWTYTYSGGVLSGWTVS